MKSQRASPLRVLFIQAQEAYRLHDTRFAGQISVQLVNPTARNPPSRASAFSAVLCPGAGLHTHGLTGKLSASHRACDGLVGPLTPENCYWFGWNKDTHRGAVPAAASRCCQFCQ